VQFENENPGARHKFISQNGRYIYHVAVIDYLQGYDIEKKAENFAKVTIKQRPEIKISCVPPKLYKRRFRNFMKESVIINQHRPFARESNRITTDISTSSFK